MKEQFKLFEYLGKAKVSERDRFILYLLAMFILLLKGYTEFTLVKNIPELLEWVLNELTKYI